MNKVMTVADLMTILCDCVDSGTLEIDSKIILQAEFFDKYTTTKETIRNPMHDYDIIKFMNEKAIRLK